MIKGNTGGDCAFTHGVADVKAFYAPRDKIQLQFGLQSLKALQHGLAVIDMTLNGLFGVTGGHGQPAGAMAAYRGGKPDLFASSGAKRLLQALTALDGRCNNDFHRDQTRAGGDTIPQVVLRDK